MTTRYSPNLTHYLSLYSLVLPLWLPLVDEGVHALLAVVQRERPVEDPLLRAQALLQRRLVRRIGRLLDHPHGHLGLPRDDVGRLDRLVHQLVDGEHFGDES